MERKVGEEFFSEFRGMSYKVIPSSRDTCDGCAFSNGTNRCSGVFEENGDCSSIYRSDGKSVVFKKVNKSKR